MNALLDAIDHPATRLILFGLVTVLVVSRATIEVLGATSRAGKELLVELRARHNAWLVMVPLAVFPILLGRTAAQFALLVLALLCHREFARATGLFRERITSGATVAATIATFLACIDNWSGFFFALVPIGVTLIVGTAMIPDRPDGFLQRVGLGVVAFLLFGSGFGHLAFLANDELFRPIMLWLLASTQLSDVFGFVVGKSIGGRKLAPNTSPGKTVSGSIGSLALTGVVSAGVGALVFRGSPLGHPIHLVTMGVLIGVLAQLGDLTISSVKRDIGVKDMGSIIPGHGGVLDRCNSIMLVAPAIFHYINRCGPGVGLGEPARVFSGFLER